MFILSYQILLATDGLKMVKTFAICQKEKYLVISLCHPLANLKSDMFGVKLLKNKEIML